MIALWSVRADTQIFLRAVGRDGSLSSRRNQSALNASRSLRCFCAGRPILFSENRPTEWRRVSENSGQSPDFPCLLADLPDRRPPGKGTDFLNRTWVLACGPRL